MQGILDTIDTNPVYTGKIPSTKKQFKYRGYTAGEEQALLVAKESKDLQMMIDNTKHIISECTYGKVDPENISAFDIEWLLLQIRSKSVGEEIELTLKCTECEKPNDSIININDIKSPVVPKNSNVVVLSENLSIIMKYPGFKVMEDFAEKDANMFQILGSLITQVVHGENVIEASGLSPAELTRFVQKMNSKNVKKLSGFLKSTPSVKYTHKIKCIHCKKEVEYIFKGLRNFFR